jgi:hypothetical protein
VKIGRTDAYTPGSFSKRLDQSNMKKLNRQTISRYRAAVASAGTQFFNATVAESQGKSELVAENVLTRVRAEAQAKASSATSLGTLANVQT